jgi:hypothetical protein
MDHSGLFGEIEMDKYREIEMDINKYREIINATYYRNAPHYGNALHS